MTFPFTYKRKLVLSIENPKDFSEKLLQNFCEVLNKERNCIAKRKDNKIDFTVSSWNIMSLKTLTFINAGHLNVKLHSQDIEVNVFLDTTVSAIVIMLLSVTFAILANISEGALNFREAIITLICAWTFLYFGNRYSCVMYFNSLLKVTYKNIS